MSESTNLLYTITQPKSYAFEPQDDITPLESVWCAFFFVTTLGAINIESHEKWPIVKRHFVEYKAKE